MKGGLLLNVVIAQSAPIFQLLTGKDKSLLVWGNALLVLDLIFDVVDRIGGLDFKSDGFTSEGLNENLHSSTKTKNQVQGGLLLDVVVREGPAVFELLTSKDKALLVRRNALLVLNLVLYVINSVRRLDLQRDGLAGHYRNPVLNATRRKNRVGKSWTYGF